MSEAAAVRADACEAERESVPEESGPIRVLEETGSLPAGDEQPASGERASCEPEPPEHLTPGTLIADRFRLGRLLGRGGHGFVYEAEHVVLGYPVAIKVLHAAYGLDARRRARFRREALLGARLRHRNVVSIHDAGELEDGSPFLVMEHVDGEDLSTVIARVGRLDPAATIEIGVQLLAAVTALYERGVIHRDIKPNNVMLQRTVDGYVEIKLLDFGISKAMRAELALKTLTADDCVLGTPQYMSPEQVKGETLDVRADLYSVGALLYECLTGVPPFDAETPGAVLAKILTEEASPVRARRPDVPEALAELVDRAVSKDPERRPRNPVEMAEALRGIAHRLALPRGADAWAALATDPAAALGTMAIGLVRPKSSSQPPVAAPVPETSGERPASRRFKHQARESTERFDIVSGLERARASLAPLGPRKGWLALAATLALPLALGVGVAAWSWGGEGAAHAAAAPVASPPKASEPVAAAPVAAAPVVAPPPAPGAAPVAAEIPSGRDVPEPVRRGPDPAELERRALAAFLAGRDAEAVSLYSRATQLAPTRASAWRGLGLAAASRHDRRTARRALRRYLDLAPAASDRAAIEQRLDGL